MIGNSNWFKRRTYTGWGITPKTWQGWAYIVGVVIFILTTYLVIFLLGLDKKYQLIIMLSLMSLVLIDTIDIVLKIRLDERECLHEAIAERNVAWFIIFILCAGLVYQIISSILNKNLYVDPFIVIALIGGSIVKISSFWYLSDK